MTDDRSRKGSASVWLRFAVYPSHFSFLLHELGDIGKESGVDGPVGVGVVVVSDSLKWPHP
jgi:hypothetical protein